MNSPRFYCPFKLSVGTVELPENVSRHIARVLRMRMNDSLTLFDGLGGQYAAKISAIEKNRVRADILHWRDEEKESPVRVTLIQALQSGEKMDLTIQKSVELGVSKIIPVISQRSVLRLTGERAEKRLEHWRGIAIAACEQCGRNRLPEILPIVPLNHCLATNSLFPALRLMLDPKADRSFSECSLPDKNMPVELLIGAEGGLPQEEMELARLNGFTGVHMGPRVLRTETAALTALAVIGNVWGDLGSAHPSQDAEKQHHV